jgi:hypothetical protein
MRPLPVLLVAILLVVPAAGQGGTKRHGIAADTKKYPQATAKEALASIIKAIKANDYDYLTAQLSDPDFVDDRVKRIYGGKFAEQVEDVRAALGPAALKQLERFLTAGKWSEEKTEAMVELEGVRGRCVRLVKKDGRWFLAHRWDRPAK